MTSEASILIMGLFLKRLLCWQACEKQLLVYSLLPKQSKFIKRIWEFAQMKGCHLKFYIYQKQYIIIMLPLVSYKLQVGIIMLFGKCLNIVRLLLTWYIALWTLGFLVRYSWNQCILPGDNTCVMINVYIITFSRNGCCFCLILGKWGSL